MVRPIILGAAASSNLLDGMKNQIRCGFHPHYKMCLVNRLCQFWSWIVDKLFLLVFFWDKFPHRPWYLFLSALTNGRRRRTNGEWADGGRFSFFVKLFFHIYVVAGTTSTRTIYCHYGRPSGRSGNAVPVPLVTIWHRPWAFLIRAENDLCIWYIKEIWRKHDNLISMSHDR